MPSVGNCASEGVPTCTIKDSGRVALRRSLAVTLTVAKTFVCATCRLSDT